MKKIYRKISAIASAVALLASIVPPVDVSAEKSPQHINNIVLFAQFSELSEKNFMAENTEKIEKLCNQADTFRSLSGYVDAISYGQTEVKSYFPQMKDGVIIPYVLSQPESSYMNAEQYAIEMVQNISVPKDIPLDGNSDGIVDNIVLVVEGKADSMDSPIWSKAFSSNGLEINGLAVNTVNIQNSYQLFESLISGGEGVLCHEFLHSLGYPDLYRNGRSGTAVGMWGIMASNSIFLQYPLAYQRATVSEWLGYKEITESGTYTLAPVSSSEGDRLYILKTPLSDTEFFAVEYRRQGAKYSDELDTKIYGTGLVVYRINTEINGNFREEDDGVYVFRPGETADGAGEGDIFRSNYGGENAPDSIGSLDWNAGIADGALTYSNGTNSGIKISDISIKDDSLTFSAEFADSSEQVLWKSIDNSALGNFRPYDLETSGGKTYLLASDGKKAAVFAIDDSGLSKITAELGSGKQNDINQPVLTFCGGTPFIMYQDYSYILHIAKYDGEKWAEIYKGSEVAQYADITADGGKIYFTYTVGSFPYSLNAACYDSEKGTIQETGKNISPNACGMKIAAVDGKQVIAFRDLSDMNKAKIAVSDGEAWKVELLSEKQCGSVEIVSDGRAAYIAPSGQGNDIYRFGNGKVEEYKVPKSVSGNAFVQVPVMVDGECFFAVNSQNPADLALYSAENFGQVGNSLSSEVVNALSLSSDGKNIYCSFVTDNGTSVIRKISVGAGGTVRGDVNGDGSFNVADAVMMQNFILGNGKLTDWKAGDVVEDGKIDVFDYIIIRKMIADSPK